MSDTSGAAAAMPLETEDLKALKRRIRETIAAIDDLNTELATLKDKLAKLSPEQDTPESVRLKLEKEKIEAKIEKKEQYHMALLSEKSLLEKPQMSDPRDGTCVASTPLFLRAFGP